MLTLLWIIATQHSLVSKLWSGRVSDKQQTKECGILDLLDPGDSIMADRGYDIMDILPPDVHLNIPPYKGQRDQVTADESEETARIASVRIHVERAIGSGRYKMHTAYCILHTAYCNLNSYLQPMFK